MRTRPAAAAAAAVVTLALAPLAAGQEPPAPVGVELDVSSALERFPGLEGVRVRVTAGRGAGAPVLAEGVTGARGALRLDVPPGTMFFDYTADGFVPLEDVEERVGPAGRSITTSLLPHPQAGPRRVTFVLNYRVAPRTVLAATLRHVSTGEHVGTGARRARIGPTCRLALDHAGTQHGGPETVTLLDPVPGTYEYWVVPRGDEGRLDAAEAVLRVYVDARLQLEARPSAGCDQRWSPFRALEVDAAPETDPGRADLRLVPWTPAELAQGSAATIGSDAVAFIDSARAEARALEKRRERDARARRERRVDAGAQRRRRTNGAACCVLPLLLAAVAYGVQQGRARGADPPA